MAVPDKADNDQYTQGRDGVLNLQLYSTTIK